MKNSLLLGMLSSSIFCNGFGKVPGDQKLRDFLFVFFFDVIFEVRSGRAAEAKKTQNAARKNLPGLRPKVTLGENLREDITTLRDLFIIIMMIQYKF